MTFHGIDTGQALQVAHLMRQAADQNMDEALDLLTENETAVGMSDWIGPIRNDLLKLQTDTRSETDTLENAVERISAADIWQSPLTAIDPPGTRGAARSAHGWTNPQRRGSTRVQDWSTEKLLAALFDTGEQGPPDWRNQHATEQPGIDELLAELKRRWADPEFQRQLILLILGQGEVPPDLQPFFDNVNWDDVDIDPGFAEAFMLAAIDADFDELPAELLPLARRIAVDYEDVLYASQQGHHAAGDLDGVAGLDVPFQLSEDAIDAFIDRFPDDDADFIRGALAYKWATAMPNYPDDLLIAELEHLESQLPDRPENGWEYAGTPLVGIDDEWVSRFRSVSEEVYDRALTSEDFRTRLSQEWDDQRLVDLSGYANYLVDFVLDNEGVPPIDGELSMPLPEYGDLLDATGFLLGTQLYATEPSDSTLEQVGKESPLIGYVLRPHANALVATDRDRHVFGGDNIAAITRSVWSNPTPDMKPQYQAESAHVWLDIAGRDHLVAYNVMIDDDGDLTDAAEGIIADQTYHAVGDAEAYHGIVEDFLDKALRAPSATGDDSLLPGGTRIVAAISGHNPETLSLGALRATTAALDIYLPILFATDPETGEWAPLDEGEGNVITVDGEEIQIDHLDRLMAQMALNRQTHNLFFEQRDRFATYLANAGAARSNNPYDWSFEQLTNMTGLLNAGLQRSEVIDAVEEYLEALNDQSGDRNVWQQLAEWVGRKGADKLLPDWATDVLTVTDLLYLIGGDELVDKTFGEGPEEPELNFDDITFQDHSYDEATVRRAAVLRAIPVGTDDRGDIVLQEVGTNETTMDDLSPSTTSVARELADDYFNATDPVARAEASREMRELFTDPESWIEHKQQIVESAADPDPMDVRIAELDPDEIEGLREWSGRAGESAEDRTTAAEQDGSATIPTSMLD